MMNTKTTLFLFLASCGGPPAVLEDELLWKSNGALVVHWTGSMWFPSFIDRLDAEAAILPEEVLKTTIVFVSCSDFVLKGRPNVRGAYFPSQNLIKVRVCGEDQALLTLSHELTHRYLQLQGDETAGVNHPSAFWDALNARLDQW